MAISRLSSWRTSRLLLLSVLLPLLLVQGRIDSTDPNLSIFLRLDDLRPGSTIPVSFSKPGSTQPHFLSKEQSDSVPFSSSSLPSLLHLFSFTPESPQGKAVGTTLSLCELEPMMGETKFCAPSLESMLDSVRSSFGPKAQLKALTTNQMRKGEKVGEESKSSSSLQKYKVLKGPEEIKTKKVMGCHTMPYPYLVYFCHSPGGETKVFNVLLGREEEVVEAVAVCHMDTSKWDRDNQSFRVLGIEPGKGPVCHFLPRFDILWADLGV